MKQYVITIEETVVDTITVEANSETEALEQVEEAYRAGDIVLEPGDLIDTTFNVEEITNE